MDIEISERLKEILAIKNWSVAEMARRCDVSRGAMEKYISGISKPGLDAFYSICVGTEVTPNWLLFGAKDHNFIDKDKLQSLLTQCAYRALDSALDKIKASESPPETLEQIKLSAIQFVWPFAKRYTHEFNKYGILRPANTTFDDSPFDRSEGD